jgi:lipopolysaccharide transport system permease protein
MTTPAGTPGHVAAAPPAPRPFWAEVVRIFFSSPWRHRALIGQLVKREVLGRYRGSVMGLLWSFLNPLLLLVVYTFVFSGIFRARWFPAREEGPVDFALVLFVGMIVHGLFAECVNRAPRLILDNTNFVKRVVFPLEILTWVAIGTALFHALASLAVWVIAFLATKGHIPATALLLPLLLVPVLLFTGGLTWFLAATTVYLRDVAQTTGAVTSLLLFLSPVFYPVTAVPEAWRPLIHLNPLTLPIEQARAVLIFGDSLDWSAWGLYTLAALAVALLGFAWFQKTRRGFADVL